MPSMAAPSSPGVSDSGERHAPKTCPVRATAASRPPTRTLTTATAVASIATPAVSGRPPAARGLGRPGTSSVRGGSDAFGMGIPFPDVGRDGVNGSGSEE